VKKWITCGDIADIFMVIATNDTQISAFIVERQFDGVSTKPLKGLLASRASHVAEVTLDNVEVPESNLVGIEGGGYTYIVNTALDHGRYSIAWAGVAIAQEALDAMVKYARSRSQFGKKLHHFQLIQAMIGDATTKVHAARALCMKAGELRRANHDDAMIETNIAKYFSSKIAMDITIDAVQLHGGNGCCNEYPVERLFREAKILEIIEGTSQVQQEIIAKYALSRYYKK
jgi:alkylation response protein AidB-like acyl-CoA dehydrogenase